MENLVKKETKKLPESIELMGKELKLKNVKKLTLNNGKKIWGVEYRLRMDSELSCHIFYTDLFLKYVGVLMNNDEEEEDIMDYVDGDSKGNYIADVDFEVGNDRYLINFIYYPLPPEKRKYPYVSVYHINPDTDAFENYRKVLDRQSIKRINIALNKAANKASMKFNPNRK